MGLESGYQSVNEHHPQQRGHLSCALFSLIVYHKETICLVWLWGGLDKSVCTAHGAGWSPAEGYVGVYIYPHYYNDI